MTVALRTRMGAVQPAPAGGAIVDTFTRANSTTTLGATEGATSVPWEPMNGVWGIDAERAKLISGSGLCVAAVETGLADNFYLQVTFRTSSHESTGVSLRATSHTNFLIVNRSKAFSVVNGAATELGAHTVFTIEDVMRVEVSGTTLEVFRNGTFVRDYTATEHQANTKHGLYEFGGRSNMWDNFEVGAL